MKKCLRNGLAISAVVLSTFGLSTISFAASKGTWMNMDGEWYCYNSNGDFYKNTFCTSNGKDYYVGDTGTLVRSDWVEYDGNYYFVNSSGQKIINDWRLTAPYDNEYGEAQWFYFQSTGKMAAGKKLTIKGKTYFFDSEGRMLTGWVTADGTDVVNEENSIDPQNSYYCDETGARLTSAWVAAAEPGTDDGDADADTYWYYLKSTGKVATGKNTNINGQTYLFGGEGRMLSGWVAYDGTKYMQIDGENDTYVLSPDTFPSVYYCGDADDGHVKKNKWMKLWRPEDSYEEDEDNDKYWYWIQADGAVYIPSGTNASDGNLYTFGDAELEHKGDVSITAKKINSKDYFFNQNGEMLSKFVEVTGSNAHMAPGMYYFGGPDDGSMKTGSQSIRDDNSDTYKFYFGTTANTKTGEVKGVGVTGAKNGKLYYKGLLVQADDFSYQTAAIDGHTFIVNKNGSIQHSQVEYKDGGDVLIDAKTEKNGDDILYQIVYSTADNQWKYSIDEEASIGTLKDYGQSIDVNRIMRTVTD